MRIRDPVGTRGAAAHLAELLARPPGQVLQVRARDGVGLHVEVDPPAPGPDRAASPAPPTVVLSHGYALDRRSWVYQRHALTAAGHRVVVWDQRGHGRSGPGAPGSHTIDQLGDDLGRVIEATAPRGPIALFGHSMGAMTVLAYAERSPQELADRVRALALVSASAGGLDRVTWGLGPRVGALVHRAGPVVAGRLAPRQAKLRALRGHTPYLDEIPVLASSFGSRVPRAVARLTADMIYGTDLAVLSSFAPSLQQHDKRGAVAALAEVPGLILVGDRDVLTAPVHSVELAELWPRALHVVVVRAGHVILLEHPEVVTRHLVSLLAGAGEEPRRPLPACSLRRTVVDLHPGRGRGAPRTGPVR